MSARMDHLPGGQSRRDGGWNGQEESGIVALIFLLRADGLRFMRFDVAMRQSGVEQVARQVAGVDAGIAMFAAHMGVRERRKELRQCEKQQCSEM